MMRRFLATAALLLLTPAWSTAAGSDDRPIVYSARYYSPPGSHITTHFHIYRINPDGTGRTQLTFGPFEDLDPVWSADGRHIYFDRNPADELSDDRVCVLDPGTRRVTMLRRLPRNPFPPDDPVSPDGRLALRLHADETIVYRTRGGAAVEHLPALPDTVDWHDNETLMAYDPSTGSLIVQPLHGPGRTVPLHRPGQSHAQIIDFLPFATVLQSRSLPPIARIETGYVTHGYVDKPLGSDQFVFLRRNNGNTGTNPSGLFYLAGLRTGTLTSVIDDRQFLVLGPDHRRYCTSHCKGLSNYSRRPYQKDEWGYPVPPYYLVWTAPLEIGDLKTGRARTISKGLVWVDSADWK